MLNFQYPTSSLFDSDGKEVVVFSDEEWNRRLAEGLTRERAAADPVVVSIEQKPAKPETKKEQKAREKAEREPDAA